MMSRILHFSSSNHSTLITHSTPITQKRRLGSYDYPIQCNIVLLVTLVAPNVQMNEAFASLLMRPSETDIAVEVGRKKVFVSRSTTNPLYAELALWDDQLICCLGNSIAVDLGEREGERERLIRASKNDIHLTMCCILGECIAFVASGSDPTDG